MGEEETEEEERHLDGLEYLKNARSQQSIFVSPINLNVATMKTIKLPSLQWHHMDDPCKKMKLLNSGHTLILSAKWYEERPFITGGPLPGNYVFSQLHFHWGATDLEGSEHTVDGTQYPLEMHVVHFKSCYLTQESALLQKDGVVICTFIFKTQKNESLQCLIDTAKLTKRCGTSSRMERWPLCQFVRQFTDDYFMYWGSINTSVYQHVIMWLVCREPLGISAKQLEVFRRMLDEEGQGISRNFRYVQPDNDITVYHVNPCPMKYATLRPIPNDEFFNKKRCSS